MSELELKLKLTADSKGLTGVVRSSAEQVEQFNKSALRTGEAGRFGARGLDELERSGQSTISVMRQLTPLVTSLAGALSIRQVASYADVWSDLTSRVRLNIGAHEEASDVMNRLSNIARGTYSSLEASAQGFALNSVTLRAMGRSTQEQLDYTEALNNALVVSGGNAQQFEFVQNSLNRALAEGSLRGQELQNVLNYGSRVAELLADELGTNVTRLRALAADGKITGDVIFNTLVRNMELLSAEADSMPATIEDAFVILRNSVLQTIGVMDQQRGVSESLAESIIGVADNIDVLVDVAGAGLLVWAARLTGKLSASAAAVIANQQAVISSARATASATATEIAWLRSVQASLSAQLASNVTSSQAISIRSQLAANTAALTAAQNAHTAALSSSTVAARAATGAMAALRGVMAALGGPVGVALLAAGSLYYFRDSVFSARGEASEAVRDIDDLAASFRDLTAAQIEHERQNIAAKIRENNVAIAEARAELQTLQDQYSNQATGNTLLPGGVRPLLDITSRQSDIAELIRQNEALEAAMESLSNRETELAERSSNARKRQAESIEKSVQSIIDDLERQRDTYGMTSVELARYNVLSAGGTAAQAELAASIAQTTANLEAEDKAAKSLRDGLAALIDELDPARAAFDAFVESQAFLDKGLEAGLLSPERYRDLTDRLVQSLADTGDEGGKEAADNFEREMRAASERVASSLQNAITSGDWGGVGASIGGALAGAIGGMVTESLMQQMSGSAGAAIFGPIGGAIAGGIVGLAANQLGGFFGLGDWDPTAERQASQGAGSVLGDINAKSESIARATRSVSKTNEELVGLNRGMLQALQTLQTGITGASTRVAQGRARADVGAPSINANFFENFGVVGGAAETYLNTLGEVFTLGLFDSLGSSIGKLLGGKSRKVDEGINVVGGALADLMDETIVEAYSTFRVKKNFLSSTKTKEQTQRLGGDVANQFSLVFESIFDSVFAAGSALGMSDAELQRRLGGFRVGDLRISLEGLNAEQQQKEIEAVFGKVFDDLALYALPFLEDFQRAGEGLGETLARVASQTQVAEEAAKRLGFGWANLADRQLVAASERLVEAAGGLEQFIGSMESFISNFASEAEQFAIAQSDITRALAEQNLMLPATREGYFDLLQAQNGATQAGAENIATLLRLQGVADKYYTMLEDSASELLRKQRDEYSAALQEAERAAMSVRNAIEGLNRSSGAFLDTSRQAAQEYLRGLVRRGSVPAGRQLDSALSSVTDIRADQFANFNDYITEVASTGRLLADLDEITRAQVTVEQQMLDRLDRQAELLEQGNAEQLAALAQIQGSVDRNTQAIQAAPRGGAVSSRIGGGTGTVSATQDVAREVRQMKSEMVEFQKSIDRHSQRTARILERIERDGLEVRQ